MDSCFAQRGPVSAAFQIGAGEDLPATVKISAENFAGTFAVEREEFRHAPVNQRITCVVVTPGAWSPREQKIVNFVAIPEELFAPDNAPLASQITVGTISQVVYLRPRTCVRTKDVMNLTHMR